MHPRALVIRTAGTNCDAEMVRAFDLAGATTDLVHLDRLVAEPQRIGDYDLIGFPGGFSYGDDIASGRIFAMRIRERLYPALRDAARRGCPMIGACNGFQVLVQVGLLPGPIPPSEGAGRSGVGPEWPETQPPPQVASLAPNDCGRFIDKWVRVVPEPDSVCIWTRDLAERFGDRADDILRLPIAHGEGRFVAASAGILDAIERNGQVALRYAAADNPNGSERDIAGICDPSGRIFGLMPHPERYLDWTNHPFWTRLDEADRRGATPGLVMFQSAVEAATSVRT